MDIGENIQKNYEKFTKKQRQIADYLLERPAEICYISLADLSRKIGCSELTILKFCKCIGLDGFTDLKAAFRNYQLTMVDVHSASSFSFPPDPTEISDILFLKEQCNSQLENMSWFYAHVDLEEISKIAKSLMDRRILYIFAHDVSHIFASYLHYRLQFMKFTAILVDLGNMKQIENAFRNMDPKDAVILFSFPNYFFSIEGIARMAAEKCGTIILLTDQVESPASSCASHTVVCRTETEFFNNFWGTPVAVISLLTDCMLRLLAAK